MNTEERASAAIARLSQITTELNARRELRDRGAEAARAAARETMLKIGPVAEKVAQHLGELGRRQREAGGWATRKTLADKEHLYGFGPEEDEAEPYDGFTTPTTNAGAAEEDTIGKLAEADETPAQPRRDTPPAMQPRRGPKHEAEDDDFSTMPTWLKER
jgi:hypothetical protein